MRYLWVVPCSFFVKKQLIKAQYMFESLSVDSRYDF